MIAGFAEKNLSSKTARDLSWNYVSFFIMGISGILMNAIVAATMGVAALGVFNQIMAVYVLTSQVAVGGVHYSGLKHVAEYADDPEALGGIRWSALFVVCLASVFVAICVYLASGTIGGIMDMGIVGAAAATAVSLTQSVVFLRWFIRRYLGIDLGLRTLSVV